MFNLFPFDLKKAILVVFVFALPLVSINFQRAPGEVPWYMKPFNFVAGSIENGYASFSQNVRSTTSLYLNLLDIKKENAALKMQLAEVNARMVRFDEIANENQRLAGLLNFKSQTPSELLPARVIGQDLFNNQHRTIRIDRGSDTQVQRGQAVIAPTGAIGYVFSVEPKSAQVLVLTDRYAVIDALVQRTRARGIVEGKSETMAILKYLHRSDDVQPGDIVVTSGLDNIFPQGFPVARVLTVDKRAYDITQRVELEPIVNLSRLEDVFVVTKAIHPPQPTPSSNAPTPTPPLKPLASEVKH